MPEGRRRKRATGSARAAVIGLLFPLILGSCADDDAITGSLADTPLTTSSISAAEQTGISIDLPQGMPSELASHLLARFQEATIANDLPLTPVGGLPEYSVKGVARAGAASDGTAVAFVWEIIGPDGRRHNIMTSNAMIRRRNSSDVDRYDPWRVVDETTLEEIADQAATELAGWYSDQVLSVELDDGLDNQLATASIDGRPEREPIDFTTPSIVQRDLSLQADSALDPAPPANQAANGLAAAAPALTSPTLSPAPAETVNMADARPVRAARPARTLYSVEVGQSPGDGQLSLAAAVQEALLNAPAGQTDSTAAYRITGSVALGPSQAGQALVRIEWQVTDRNGTPLGLVTQENSVAATSVSGAWGEVALVAGQAAADGILALVGAEEPPA